MVVDFNKWYQLPRHSNAFTIRIDEYVSVKCYFMADLKINVTKHIISGAYHRLSRRLEIHSPGNFLLFQCQWLLADLRSRGTVS